MYSLLCIPPGAANDFFGPEVTKHPRKLAELTLRQLVEVSNWGNERGYNLAIPRGSWMRSEIMKIMFEEGQTHSCKDHTAGRLKAGNCVCSG